MRLFILIFLLILNVSSYSSEILKYQLDSLIKNIMDKNVKFGIYVKSLSGSDFEYTYNHTSPFIPASNQKLLTTISAIYNLSPDYKYKTVIGTDGYVKDSVLHGNLYLIGGGDPTFTVDDLGKMIENLKSYGVNKIEGNLIGDNSYFTEEGIASGWPESDLNYCYTARFSGLSINQNCLKIFVNVKDSKIYVNMDPDNDYYQIENKIRISKKGEYVFLKTEGNRLILEGILPPKKNLSFEFSTPVNQPSLFTMHVFSKVLNEKGIKLSGRIYLSKVLSYKPLVIHESKPLREIIKKANKDSNNFYAEQIFRTIGKVVYGDGSVASSSKAILNTLKKMGVSVENIRIYDGSGLSRYNYLTPEALVKVLDYIYKTPYFYDFYESLAISGVDGTLKHRLNDPILRGKIIAKTGYIKGVKSLSGYVKALNGEIFVFSVLINDLKTTEIATNIQEQVCGILANYPNIVGVKNLDSDEFLRIIK